MSARTETVKLRRGSKLSLDCQHAIVTARYCVELDEKTSIKCVRVRISQGYTLHFSEDRFNELFTKAAR